MAMANVGPEITKAGISAAATQMVGSLDEFKAREQALVALLTLTTDADLIGLGFTTDDVTFIRTGLGALDQMVQQGLTNATIKAFTDRLRNYGA